MNIIDTMMREKESLEDVINNCSDMLKHLPKGRLSIQHKRGKAYYVKHIGKDQEYLKKGSKEIEMLKDRYMAELVLKNASTDLKLMDHALSEYKQYDPNLLMQTVSKCYQGISAGAIQSMGFIYTAGFNDRKPNTRYKSGLIHTDTNGNDVRTKSELAISGIYELLGIFAEYEYVLALPDGNEVYPDFTTVSELRHVRLFHEHIGNLKDPDKMAQDIWKFKEYCKYNIYPYDRVLYTFDDPKGGFDAEAVKQLIMMFMR